MNVKMFLVIVFAVICSLPAAAWVVRTSPIVKVKSYYCKNAEDPKLHRNGSGVVVTRGAKTYVVTSGHVPLHEGREAKLQEICHRIVAEDESQYDGALVAANFLKDLAILSIRDGNHARTNKTLVRDLVTKAHDLDKMPVKGPEVTTMDKVFVTGYPFATPAKDSATRYRGEVASIKSTRTTLDLKQVIEVNGMSEYGQSGGALLTEDGAYLGLLSHQFLRGSVGAVTTVTDHSAPKDDKEAKERRAMPMISIAIPAVTVAEWIDSVHNENAGSDLRLFPIPTQPTQISTVFESYRLTEQHCNHISTLGPAGGHGGGMGGPAPAPTNIATPCSIAISVDDKAEWQPWPWRTRDAMTTIRTALRTNPQQYLYAVRKGDITLPVQNLVGTMKYLRDGYVPVLSATAPSGAVGNMIDFGGYQKLAAETLKTELDLLTKLDELSKKIVNLNAKLANQPKLAIELLWKDLDEEERTLLTKISRTTEKAGPGHEHLWMLSDPYMLKIWQGALDTDKMTYYQLARRANFSAPGRTKILKDVNQLLLDTYRAWFRVSLKPGGLLEAWNDKNPLERMWISMGASFFYENWMAFTPDERKDVWNRQFVTAHEKLLLIESIHFYFKDVKIKTELDGLAHEFGKPLWEEWKAAVEKGTQAQWWKKADYGKRAWIYNLANLPGQEVNMLVETRKICSGPLGLAVDLPPFENE